MPLIKETLGEIYRFILTFIWQLYKAIGFQVRDWDIQLAQKYVLWKRLCIWGVVIVVVGGVTLFIATLIGGKFLQAMNALGTNSYGQTAP